MNSKRLDVLLEPGEDFALLAFGVVAFPLEAMGAHPAVKVGYGGASAGAFMALRVATIEAEVFTVILGGSGGGCVHWLGGFRS